MNVLSMFQTNGNAFYLLFEQAAANNVEAAKLLEKIYTKKEKPGGNIKRIQALERENDEILHKIFYEINRTFVTPLDREDIIDIAHALDDVMDFICTAADNFDIYQVKTPTSYSKDFTAIILEATRTIHVGLPKLRKRKTFKDVEKTIIEINRLENEADLLFTTGVKALFKKKHNAVDIIRFQSIYQAMEEAIDSCERIANVLGGLTIKYA